jgi:hypothetical protein
MRASLLAKPRVVMPYMGRAAIYAEKIKAVTRENYTGLYVCLGASSRSPKSSNK